MSQTFICKVSVASDQNSHKRCSNHRSCSNPATKLVCIYTEDDKFVDGDYSCDDTGCQTHVKNTLVQKQETATGT